MSIWVRSALLLIMKIRVIKAIYRLNAKGYEWLHLPSPDPISLHFRNCCWYFSIFHWIFPSNCWARFVHVFAFEIRM